jgi:DNA-binding beta-propeller fold protein YncE
MVSKIRVSDGALLNSFPTGGGHPYDVVFDGANIWVVNNGSDTVSKIRPSDGALLGTFSTGGIQPYAAAFDGANIWVTNALSGTVSKIRAADGANLGMFATGANADGVAFDGNNILGCELVQQHSVQDTCNRRHQSRHGCHWCKSRRRRL